MAISHINGVAASLISAVNAKLKSAISAINGITASFSSGSSGAGPIPTFVAAGTGASGTGSISPGLPAGWAQNDIFVMLTESGPSEPVTAPAGWTDMNVPTGNGASQLGVFWRRATASESAPTVADSGNHTHAIIMAFRGCITTGSPWDVSQSSTNNLNGGTSAGADRITGITTSVNNCLIVGAVTANSGSAGSFFSFWTCAALSSVTEQVDYSGTSVVRHIGAVTGELAVAGPTGNIRNTTLNTSNFGGQFCGALMAP